MHPYLGRFEDAVLEGQAAARAALKLKNNGFYPDVIVAHAGFGAGLYLKDIFPSARRIGFFEWYYTSEVGSDVEFCIGSRELMSFRRSDEASIWNAVSLLELAQSDEMVTPTNFQRQQFPLRFRESIKLIHEGVDFQLLKNLRQSSQPRPSCLPPDKSVPVVTHVVRGFELYRGFPQAVKAFVHLQKILPDVHILIVGADQVCYGGTSGSKW